MSQHSNTHSNKRSYTHSFMHSFINASQVNYCPKMGKRLMKSKLATDSANLTGSGRLLQSSKATTSKVAASGFKIRAWSSLNTIQFILEALCCYKVSVALVYVQDLGHVGLSMLLIKKNLNEFCLLSKEACFNPMKPFMVKKIKHFT